MPSRLKSLELHGYKTFASRTPFEFAGTVTAIVGPNGSGKSNIADAVRWVLGEQSYSLLRGKKTEDMIFAGSDQRPRASMASATIVFDNSDNWLPIDFSEVAITRRAYRDGENEYLLNGQRVRLRDVSELLAQSGLAERTYTIIGQGLVDAALALKAEERRRLFEEAAGIGLHRSRREEALKRLETTRRNMERVQDILAELQPRLKSLERQARRTGEYEQVKNDLRNVLREWYGYHWHNAQTELTEAREAAGSKEYALEEARQEQASLDEKLSARRDHIQNLRIQSSEWHRRLANVHSQWEEVSRELAITDERLRSLSEQRQNSQEEAQRFAEELDLYQERIDASAQEVAGREKEVTEAVSQAAAVRKMVEDRQAERTEVEKQVQEARQVLGAITARQSHLQARLAERKTQAQRQAELLEAAENDLASADRELERAKDQIHKEEKNQVQAIAAHQSAQAAVQTYQKQREELESERKALQDRRSQAAAEAARLKAQADVLEQAENDLSGYTNGARLIIQAARQARIKGSRGAFSSELDVPDELEIAIGAALGEFINAVLLQGDEGIEAALNLLEGEASRAALLPIDGLVTGKPDGTDKQNLKARGVLGIASEVIGSPPEIRPVVDLLLGQVLLVQDRSTARRVLPMLDAGWRAVTLKGEVFYAAGPIVAGLDKKPGLLSRPRRRRELREQLTELEKQLTALDGQIQVHGERLVGLRNEGEGLTQEAAQARKKEEDARRAYNQAELALEKARRQRQWQKEQLERLEEDIRRDAVETEKLEVELAPLEAEIGSAWQRMRDHISGLSSLELDEFQTQLAHWNTRIAVAERAVLEAKNRCKEHQATLERVKNRLKALHSKMDEYANSIHELEGQKVSLRKSEISLSKERETLRLLIEPGEKEVEAAEREQAELHVFESTARQALSNAEHYHAQARILLAKRQEALDSMRRRIEDDFGLVAFEYAEDISGPTPLPLDGMVEQLPKVRVLGPDIDETIKRLRGQIRRIGAVNPEAQIEFEQVKERFTFLNEQVADLNKAEIDVKAVITELDLIMEREFRKTFDAVAQEFREIFSRLFGGGSARLLLTNPDDLTDTGIDIEARLPGRKTQGLSLLSGGERSITATALVFSLLKVSPTPFCVLDEVDAMLDEANVGRFRELLRELSQSTQFIIVTHNRNTVQVADVIYGVTMGRDMSSQVISLKLDEVSRIVD
jgi:chromosome segregation protein